MDSKKNAAVSAAVRAVRGIVYNEPPPGLTMRGPIDVLSVRTRAPLHYMANNTPGGVVDAMDGGRGIVGAVLNVQYRDGHGTRTIFASGLAIVDGGFIVWEGNVGWFVEVPKINDTLGEVPQ